MKYLLRINAYLRETRLALLAVAVMMTISLLMGIMVMGKVQYLRVNYDVVASAEDETSNVYFFQEMISINEIMSGQAFSENTANAMIDELNESPAVEHVYTIHVANPIEYDGNSISILLYDPELLELFPGLREIGIFFTESDGCVLGSRMFNDVEIGDAIELKLFQPEVHTEDFLVTGRLSYPYQYMIFSSGGTYITANNLFESGDIIIMQGTEKLLNNLSRVAHITTVTNFFIRFSNDANQEDISAVMQTLGKRGEAISLSELLERSAEDLQEAYLELLPMPLFLVFVSAISYFSTLILTFKKKEYEMAIGYLCGASRRQCTFVVLGTFCMVSFIPILISTGVIAAIPYLDWKGYIEVHEHLFDSRCIWLPVGYCLMSLLVSVATTWLQMRSHTPLTLLRGARR